MTGRFEVQTEHGKLVMTVEERRHGCYILFEEPESGFTCKPDEITIQGQEITLHTTFYMVPDIRHTAILTYDGDGYQCEGSLALGGKLSGRAVRLSGSTKYEKMQQEIPQLRTGKRVHRTDAEITEAVEELLNQMTLGEKVGQMSQSAGNNTSEIGNDIEKNMSLEEAISKGMVGSVISMTAVENLYEYQKIAVEQSRLGIPLMFCQDVIHGYQTIFPVPLASACSFAMDWIERANRAAAKEATANGIMYAFSPMLDIARDPRWGRVVEGGGEDPYLVSRIAEAQVRGYQGDDLSAPDTMIACLKHFVGYSAAEGGRDYNTVEISDTTLRNIYLPPFRAGIAAGAASVMNSFNTMNGVPVAVSRRILKDLLREELGFEGILISDFAAVEEAVAHGAAEDDKDAVRKSVLATMDFEMGTGLFNRYLEELVREGEVPQQYIDDSVKRILFYKFKTGLMDDPYLYIRPEEQNLILCEEHQKISREIGKRSIVLLKNDGVLPIQAGARIALIGPKADSLDLLGPWQFTRYDQETVTLREGLEQKGLKVRYEEGCKVSECIKGGCNRAVHLATEADYVILALGEESSMTGEAASRQYIGLPECQMELARAVCESEKKVILVLTNGRPILLDWFADHVEAIVETWFLGTQAGNAIADVLVGDYNPGGKLAISFPRNQGQIPVYYNHLRTGRPYQEGSPLRFLSRYQDGSNEPLYSFGYGLSYTTFEISDMKLSGEQMDREGALEVSVRVKNTGNMTGEETVQLYLRDVAASIARPVKELKDFYKVMLEPGEEKIVCFTITKEKLGFYNEENIWCCETGKFLVMVGNSSRDRDLMTVEFVLTE